MYCLWKDSGDFEPILSGRDGRHIAEKAEAGAEAETGSKKPSSHGMAPTTPGAVLTAAQFPEEKDAQAGQAQPLWTVIRIFAPTLHQAAFSPPSDPSPPTQFSHSCHVY